jgi:hypothetical protein
MLPGFVVSGWNGCHIARAHDILADLFNAMDYQHQHRYNCHGYIFTYDDAHDAYKDLLGHSTRGRNAGEFDPDNAECGTCQSYPRPLVLLIMLLSECAHPLM